MVKKVIFMLCVIVGYVIAYNQFNQHELNAYSLPKSKEDVSTYINTDNGNLRFCRIRYATQQNVQVKEVKVPGKHTKEIVKEYVLIGELLPKPQIQLLPTDQWVVEIPSKLTFNEEVSNEE